MDRMRFAIRYETAYRYDEPVTDNLNVLRVTPAATPTQEVEDFRVNIDPEARIHRHSDYFGTQVVEFGITRPHEYLTIDVRARVATTAPPDPPAGGWELLERPGYHAPVAEYLLQVPIDGKWSGTLAELRGTARGATPAETAKALCELIPDRFEYRPGVTFVGSTVDDLLEGGAGVCQDFVHLSLILLRRHGIAARYVSGYLFAAPEDGGTDSVEVDTHAWIEALIPSANGGGPAWVGADPTNRTLAGETHVKIGHGRFYGDVPPIKGVYRGAGGEAEHDVSVKMTRLD
jgi:transglutaminase-like putative cysteine protease